MVLPMGSMGLVYLPTWMVDFYGKCSYLYHTWILWVIKRSTKWVLTLHDVPCHPTKSWQRWSVSIRKLHSHTFYFPTKRLVLTTVQSESHKHPLKGLQKDPYHLVHSSHFDIGTFFSKKTTVAAGISPYHHNLTSKSGHSTPLTN